MYTPIRADFLPPCRLSGPAQAEEFRLPLNKIGAYVAKHFECVWGTISGECAPRIWHRELTHTGLIPSTPEEIAAYKNTHPHH